MDEVRKLFNQIEYIVRKSENYVPRNYQTVGGMWTVDTYKKGDVTFQLMDEGYTSVIRTEDVIVTDGRKDGKQVIWFDRGGLQDLHIVFERLSEVGGRII